MKITKKEIDQLIQVLKENDIAKIEYEEDDYKIKLNKSTAQSESIKIDEVPKVKPDKQADKNTKEIKCPLVGHFYLTKTPLDEPYVKVGDVIKKGDVIGILEAMKVSNEIKSDISGEIVDIVIENGQFVDYDCTLMKVKEE